MKQFDFSIVIPVFNRGALLRHTLASVRRASVNLRVETIVVDDGSNVPVAEVLQQIGIGVDQVIRQSNRGLLFARLAGLSAARGSYVLFLDSDDLISPDKLDAHVAAFQTGADATYSDSAHQVIDAERGPLGVPVHNAPLPTTSDGAEFFISVQPAPHSPAFRTALLRGIVEQPLFQPSHLYNPVAEIWFYHLCAPAGLAVAHCGGTAIVGGHRGERLTNHWEKLGVASLGVQEAFARHCPVDTEDGRRARAFAAAKALGAWRRLPRGFSPAFADRLWSVWHGSQVEPALKLLGGRGFQLLARFVGTGATARILHRLQAGHYEQCRTMNDDALAHLLKQLPTP